MPDAGVKPSAVFFQQGVSSRSSLESRCARTAPPPSPDVGRKQRTFPRAGNYPFLEVLLDGQKKIIHAGVQGFRCQAGDSAGLKDSEVMASQKLTNCCVAAIALATSTYGKYASLLDNRAPCIWRFLLSHL